MTERGYRYTGEWPPLDILRQFPNWEYALDEEGEEGQDETTLRPSVDQTSINDDVAFTAGIATLPDGRQLPCLVEISFGEACGATVYVNGNWAWCIRLVGESAKWIALTFDWMPPQEGPPLPKKTDFPAEVETLLPASETSKPYRITVPEIES